MAALQIVQAQVVPVNVKYFKSYQTNPKMTEKYFLDSHGRNCKQLKNGLWPIRNPLLNPLSYGVINSNRRVSVLSGCR
jgi:hypothetical protein